MSRYEKRLKEITQRVTAHYLEHARCLDASPIYYTYALLDPRKPGTWKYAVEGKTISFDHEPFYVGKGKGHRMTAHLERKANHRNNNHKGNLIAKIRKLGYEPLVKQVSAPEPEAIAFAKEHLLIKAIGRADLKLGPLTNLSNGGQGPSGFVHSQKLRRAVSKVHKGKIVSEETRERLRIANTGKTHSAETRAKLSAALKGRKLSEEHKAKISASNKGKKMSPEAIAKWLKSRAGFRHSEESKAKMRKPKSETAKINMSEAAKKRPPISEETRAKLSAFQSTRPRRRWTEAEKLAHSRLKRAQFLARQKTLA